MLTRIRKWVARAVALVVTVLTLGRLTVDWDGVQSEGSSRGERGAITASVDTEPRDDERSS